MLGAGVPKATVHEDRHPSARENQIGAASDCGDRPNIDAVPKAAPVKQERRAISGTVSRVRWRCILIRTWAEDASGTSEPDALVFSCLLGNRG